MSNDWGWHNKEDKDAIVVQSVQAIAVYTNPAGEIVIRQQDSGGEDDSVIVVPRSMVLLIAKALKAEFSKKFIPD